MTRPVDWHPLADADPVPGDPDEIERLARRHADVGVELARQASSLRRLAAADGWEGDAGRAFAVSAGDLAAVLDKAGRRYEVASTVLAGYAPELWHAQAIADRALVEARDAQAAIDATHPAEALPASLTAAAGRSRQSAYHDGVESLRRAQRHLRDAVEHRDLHSSRAARVIRQAIEDDGLADSWWDRFSYVITLLSVAAPGPWTAAPSADDRLVVAERVEGDPRWPWQWVNDGFFDLTTGYEAQDHARHIAKVAEEAGIDPRLLMGVVLNESGMRQRVPAFKNFDNPLWAMQRLGIRGGASVGMTSLQSEVFDATVRRHPDRFGDVTWYDLVHDNGLSIRVTAWHLHDLQALLPADSAERSGYSREELAAYGYNAGEERLAETAYDGASLVTQGEDYVRKFRMNWSKADDFFCQSEQWKCVER